MKNASTLCNEFILHVTDTEITSNAKRFSTFTEQFNYLCALHTFGQKKSNEKMNKKPPTHESVLLLFTSAVRFFVRRLCLTFRQSIKLKAFPTYSVRAKRYRISVFIVNILFSRRIIRDPLNCSDAFIDRLYRFFSLTVPLFPFVFAMRSSLLTINLSNDIWISDIYHLLFALCALDFFAYFVRSLVLALVYAM